MILTIATAIVLAVVTVNFVRALRALRHMNVALDEAIELSAKRRATLDEVAGIVNQAARRERTV